MKVIIVGAGPTGAVLALILVKQGISVTLVEAAKAFNRVFRGEGLMPSGLTALAEMGLGELLLRVPQRKIDAWEFILGEKRLFRVDEPMGADYPCTLVSQSDLLPALITAATSYESFEFIQGIAVKDLSWDNGRVTGVILSDGQQITGDLVIGADGRNSVVRQRAGLQLISQPQNIDVLWFKLAATPELAQDNVFRTIVSQSQIFSIFHGTESDKLHLAWVISQGEKNDRKPTEWAEIFADLSSPWLAAHFRHYAATIESPIKLSVVVGCCPQWYAPGVLLLGDAAHPMSPVRAQGINVALRDVIVAANKLVPVLISGTEYQKIDGALSEIQRERQPEIKRLQKLQSQEAAKGEKLRKYPVLRSLLVNLPLLNKIVKYLWVKKQFPLRHGITKVTLGIDINK